MRIDRTVPAGLIAPALAFLLQSSSFGSSAPTVANQEPQIFHDSIACWPNDEFAIVQASLAPALEVRNAKLYFRTAEGSDFHFVEMSVNAQGQARAVVPKAALNTPEVIYLIEMVTTGFSSERTPQFNVPVNQAAACRASNPNLNIYSGQDPNIAVGSVRPGMAQTPRGFQATGITRFGGSSGLRSASASAVGSGSSGGGGAGKYVLLGLGGAGAATAAVLAGGNSENSSPSATTSMVAAVTTTVTTGGGGSTTTAAGGGNPSTTSSTPGGVTTTTSTGGGTTTSTGGGGTTTTTTGGGTTTTTGGGTTSSSTSISTTSSSTTSSTTTSVAAGPAEISVSVTDNPDPVVSGNNMAYTITVTNNGDTTATNFNVVNTITGGSVNFNTGGCSNGNPSICFISSLAKGASFVASLQVPTSGPGTISNLLTSAYPGDPVPGNNSFSESTTVVSSLRTAESADASSRSLGFRTRLRVGEGARGYIVVNDTIRRDIDSTAPRRVSIEGARGRNQFEAFYDALGQGSWRFDFSSTDGYQAGTLNIESGEVSSMDGQSVVFSVRGQGQIRFSLELR